MKQKMGAAGSAANQNAEYSLEDAPDQLESVIPKHLSQHEFRIGPANETFRVRMPCKRFRLDS